MLGGVPLRVARLVVDWLGQVRPQFEARRLRQGTRGHGEPRDTGAAATAAAAAAAATAAGGGGGGGGGTCRRATIGFTSRSMSASFVSGSSTCAGRALRGPRPTAAIAGGRAHLEHEGVAAAGASVPQWVDAEEHVLGRHPLLKYDRVLREARAA